MCAASNVKVSVLTLWTDTIANASGEVELVRGPGEVGQFLFALPVGQEPDCGETRFCGIPPVPDSVHLFGVDDPESIGRGTP